MSIKNILPLVNRPSRYSGNEFNIVRKNWHDVSLRAALVFPDLYEIGMSHQGLQVLYHLLNSRDDILAERAYAPAPDMEELLRDSGKSLFSLETHHDLSEFDFLGITLPYELCYTNILTILNLAGIPFRSSERDGNHPLVIGGGPCAFHPEPVADFFDAILLGDGEEAIMEIADLLILSKTHGWERKEVLARLASVEGVYVPSFFLAEYDGEGNFTGVNRRDDIGPVRRRILADLEHSGGFRPLVPLSRIVHDRLGIEIARGCTRGCRFCQAGIIYRPVRERSPERILELAEKGIAESGFDEVALLSLSTGDYSCIGDLMVRLMDRLVRDRVSVSMPSMRVGSLTPEMMEQIRRVRKSGFTLAPEAGTDRLRQVINKGITEEDLLATSRAAFEMGWKLLKFYFMFGLPTETDEDMAAIPQLARRALQASGNTGGKRINISVATFVPKPHTPFQRAAQLGINEGYSRIDFLKKEFRGKPFQLKWHDPHQSFLEGVMSRGDRRLSMLIEKAWQLGARFDAWNEYFNLDTWLAAAVECGTDLDSYLRERSADEPLPWDHLDCGVDLSFLDEEAKKAKEGIYTPDCRVHGCQKCGLCDFKTIKPQVVKCDEPAKKILAKKAAPKKPAEESTANKIVYRIDYSRTGLARFLGHLEMIQMFYRVLRRAELPVNFSKGFNPSQRVTFSPALPLGTESMAEYLLIEVSQPLVEPEKVMDILNLQLPEGFEVLKVELTSGRVEQRLLTCYHVRPMVVVDRSLLSSAISGKEMIISVMRKGRERRIDAQPMVKGMKEIEDGVVELLLETETGKAALKPVEIISAVLGLSEKEAAMARVKKIWCSGTDQV